MENRRDWEKVGKLVEKIEELGLSYAEGARKFGVKPWVVYEYNRRRRRGKDSPSAAKPEGGEPAAGDVQAPGDKDKNPGLPQQVCSLIADYRRKHPDHGFKRIQEVLKSKYLLVVSRKQIRRVLKKEGLLDLLDSSFDRAAEPAKGSRRFEAAYPGELYQMDVTYIYLTGIPVLYLAVIVDDHSRFCVGAKLCRDQRAVTLIGALHEAIVRHGQPKKLLTDQASGFYSWSGNETVFQQYLDQMGIEHLVSEPHSPQTAGKVERLIQTIKQELIEKRTLAGAEEAQQAIAAFVHSYNLERPHQALGGLRPADRFYGVAGETGRIEAELASRQIDPSKGYLVYKIHGRSLSVVCSGDGLEVYLDGARLRKE